MNHMQKITAVIDYIEAHLTQKLDLDMIADAVHYSRHYLQRVFSKSVGLTLHDYLQRRQLTEAAKLLVFSNKPILEIALLSGYESQQAFHSVFKALYKQTPHQYRENERFYPLQLKYEFGGRFEMLDKKAGEPWRVHFAAPADIPGWMALVRLTIDGFPHLHEEEYIEVLKQHIQKKQALILKDGETAIGVMLFSRGTGCIEFMAAHPLYRQKGIPKALLEKVMCVLVDAKEISTTTYREGDKADTGHRSQILALGFAEAELLTEFGYPTQRFVLPKHSVINENEC